MATEVGPHKFDPYSFIDAWLRRGRCKVCYAPQWVHPTRWWSPARPIGDRRRPPKDDYYNRRFGKEKG